MQDLFLNGKGHGSVAATLLNHNMDVGALRPFIGSDGRSYVTITENGKPKTYVTNAPTSLRKDEWIRLDRQIMVAAKQRLRAVADLRASGLVLNIPNGMGTTFLQYQTMGDITDATISMDALRKAENDRPEFDLAGIPIPIIHKDFQFTARQIAVSRNGGAPLDTITADLAGRKVAEEAEKLLVGTAGSFSYGGGTLYGYTNHPGRITKTIADPSALGWTPSDTVADVLAARQLLIDDLHFGPYVLYFGTAWSQYLDEDYSAAKGDATLRERILRIENISSIRTLDYLTGFQMLMVQMTPDVVREVIGMDITTLQWETNGGMELHFKVMAIMVPQIRIDPASNSGLVHGNV
jgi:hypothetical protein